MVEDLSSLAGKVDCLFSAHVIEHLPNPKLIVETARQLLAPSGMAITFCPNGDSSSSWSNHYSDLWGKHHPSVITPAFLQWACSSAGLSVRTYSDPYDLCAILSGAEVTSLPGEELCAIMRRP
jgi:2-polyprenyl-3-methyl-5-hydroxy-6-metoxy-1,4-benzoquinol methylase